ncbi:Trk system potassium transporter TrkA [Aminobacter sp. NyZ550]|jgi:trk system potassium uptake protein TrkA|uniref:Trk system potassium uptake protein TrkA n=1 Tax=Aminobacter aminovorans TaxID=83263 RepID=A0AAC8YQM3_AMIAI|nr:MULTISPECIES: Trk system potassium transporter TrkA [Aminobacter]AMS42693.1 potassium transporter TrkA [Aminobacter aminovorans]MBB3704539.1 trk system potassium uptake protein TrkA [Aminobacter aminovorans]MRX36852.1 Trk system potassium transporter TrkA [Aminobacter sp. MDW-2]QNH32754.1 Trk system potassium transporter TrkA [Aminobacter sp. MDW-2]QOF71932.1 Trk system potassium transporter TrkA [Aminobacter sp. SR38]
MRVIICGAGQVGYGIAERLAAEKNDVSIIDTAPELIQAVRDQLDVRGFVGHGSHPEVLEAAGAQNADMIIAVTLFDEVNIVACEVAHALFNVPMKVARIRSQSYLQPHYQDLFSREHLPIDVIISPELEVGEMVLRRITLPGAVDVVRFAENHIIMVAIECLEDCPVINTPLAQLSELFPDLPSTVVGVTRNGRLFIPHSADQLVAGDLAYVVTTKEQVRRTLGLFGHDEQEATRIVIAGGGNIGLFVARTLEQRQSRTKIKIIEANKERAVKVADVLRRTVVLNGSALDQKLLMEADIQDADLMVALTNNDQVNILSSVMAKRLGCKGNLALINNPAYHDLTKPLGIDAHVNPSAVTISRVLQHVRRGRIRQVHSIQRGAAEIIEAEALETSPLVGTLLRDLELPDGMRIGAIYRDGHVVKPSGSVKIKPRDRVVIFALDKAVKQVEQMFRVSLEFF